MQITQSSQSMQKEALNLLKQGKRLVLVPTMGALHEGHLALVDCAKEVGDPVVLSVFVNPTQFGPNEDFEKYPRLLQKDQELAKARGVDYFFAPLVEDIYPPGDQTFVIVSEVTRGLCGAFRPGHFRGVATVVAKLFNICQPQAAVFGEKDFQQLQVIRRMVKDLHFPIKIIGLPTVRESDGLALSSRNAYLSTDERKLAIKLPRALFWAVESVKKGQKHSAALIKEVKRQLGSPKIKIDYVEIVNAETLEPLEQLKKPARLLAAIYVGKTRLIDNIAL